MALNTLTGGAFQSCLGEPLSNGYLVCELSHDEQETSTTPHGQVVGGLRRTIFLDNNGNAATGSQLWANDTMSPASSYYLVNAFRQDGTLAWKAPQYWQIASSPSPFDLGSLVPTNPPGSGLGSFSSITLQTNEVNNGSQTLLDLHAGTNMTLTDNGSGRVTLDASGGANFSTAGNGYFFGSQSHPLVYTGTGGDPAHPTSSNTVVVAQVELLASYTVRQLSTYCVTGTGGGGTWTCGIYTIDGNTKLIDAGTGAFTTLASQTPFTITLGSPVALSPGVYWFAYASTAAGSMGSWLCLSGDLFYNAQINLGATRFGTAANALSAGALPATLGTLTALTKSLAINIPIVQFTV